MVTLRRWRASLASMPKGAVPKLSEAVGSALRPVLRPALQAQADVLGIAIELLERDQPDRPRTFDTGGGVPALSGEVFTDGKSVFVVEVGVPDRSSRWSGDGAAESHFVILSCIGPELDTPGEQALIVAVNNLFEVTLTPAPCESGRFKELQQEGRTSPAPPTDKELEGARALAERDVRTLTGAIRSTGGLLARDLSKQLPPDARERASMVQQVLQDKGLVEQEIVVICRRSQMQVARVPSRGVLMSMSNDGVRCACGRPVADEVVEEALVASDLCRSLLDGSKWLTFLLLEELRLIGVPFNQTLIELQMGGDEVDCLAVIGGELVFFELKDKDFNLGHAYSFGAKMGAVGPDHSVIMTTHKVGADARDHFERSRLARSGRRGLSRMPDDGPEPRYIEGLENLRSGIEGIASSIYRKNAQTILKDVLPFAIVRSEALLAALEPQDAPADLSGEHAATPDRDVSELSEAEPATAN